MLGGGWHHEVTAHNQVVIPHGSAADVVRVYSATQWAVLVKPDQPLPLHLLASEPLVASTKPNLVTPPGDHLLGASSSCVAVPNCDVPLPKQLRNKATPIVRDPEVTRGAALVGPGDDRTSKALLLGWEEAINDEANWSIVFKITLTHEAGVGSPSHCPIGKEVDTAFEFAVAVFAAAAAFSLRHNWVGAEWAGTGHSAAVDTCPSSEDREQGQDDGSSN